MRINKYPFFLWLTQSREDFKLDFKNLKVSSDDVGESSLKKVPIYFIALLRYLPFLFVLPYLYYPSNKNDLIPFIGAFVVVISMLFVYLKTNLIFFKTYVITICIVNVVLIFLINDYAVFLDIGITFFAEIGIFAILYLDIFYFKGYKNWYFLENFKNEIDIKFAEKKQRKFLFFLKPKTGFNISKRFYVKGYFLRIENEDVK
ncbi:hypothetical protein D3M61_11400 [Aliarcobacter butzleri]|uniref:hypothetical protein n=1 Tax=Aliarcobacter butzleri TaxID=28197 RepID=UPI00102D9F6A|nr:hypothetical protein [Aliarcobacter butzleri]RZV12753.1 hypothetical protein D3M61_11400 [Aliarcobacter butzleri]